ncbi:MAG: hypothetical protein M0R73_06610 [Dehalococcoidia bacterium]|nr:hypothetical protein [Dehalococcoidia bacterium]
MAEVSEPAGVQKVATGVPGLDAVLHGGSPPEQRHLLIGPPGAGKTTPARQFLIDGAARGEGVLDVTLAESAAELRQVARSHNGSRDDVTVREFTPSKEQPSEEQQYTVGTPRFLGDLTSLLNRNDR